MSGDTGHAAAWLNGVRERADQADRALTLGGNFGEAAARSQADVPRLLAAVEAVLKEHRPEDHGACLGCRAECLYCESEHEWPCPVVQAITAKLLGKEE